MSAARDQNDRLLDGTLPTDPSADARPMEPPSGVRKVVAELAPNGVAKDEQAEAALLGILLWCGAFATEAVTVAGVVDLLAADGEAFSIGRHALIYQTICALAESGQPVDAVSVHSALIVARKSHQVGGLEYLEKLVSLADTHSPAKARRYAQAIRDTWLRRRIEQAAVDVVLQCRAGKIDAGEAAALAIESFRPIGEAVSSDAGVTSIKSSVVAIYKTLESGIRQECLATGIRDLDYAIGGFFPRETSVLGARTSVGKSALAAQIACHVARPDDRVGVLYVTLEMSARAFTSRLISARAAVPARGIRRNTVNSDDMLKIQAAAFELCKLRIYFADTSSQTLMNVHAKARQFAATMAREGVRLGLIVIDHIGLVKPSGKGLERKRNEQVAETSRGLRFLAEQHGCHVLALAQINRGSEARKGTDKMPKLHDLKESGAIEEDADNVILLHRDRDERGMFVQEAPAWCVVAKSRNDDLAAFKLRYDGSHVRFHDWSGE